MNGRMRRLLEQNTVAVVAGEFGGEIIPGGEAEGRKPSDFDPEQLALGTATEMEHTHDPRMAMEIAMDHLVEDPEYYTKLLAIGL